MKLPAFLLSLALFLSPVQAPAGELRILASFLPMYLFTRNVMGNAGGVSLDLMLPASLGRVMPADYLISIDEHSRNGKWRWRIRFYNGRSGAFVEVREIPIVDEHLRWTLDRALAALKKTLLDPSIDVSIPEPPEEVFPPPSLHLVDELFTDCQQGACLPHLPDLERLAENDPAFLADLLANPLIVSALQKEAQDATTFARISLLAGSAVDAVLKLAAELQKTENKTARIKLLSLLIKAHIAALHVDETLAISDELRKLDASSATAAWGSGWALLEKGQHAAAIPYLQEVVRREPGNGRALERLIACYQQTGNLAQFWEAKARLAELFARQGNYLRANSQLMELLDHDFRHPWLNGLVLPLLLPLDRKNLATMLNQQTILHDRNESEVFWYLARLLLQEGKLNEADTALRAALQVDPHNVRLLNLALEFALDANRLADAQIFIERLAPEDRDPFLSIRFLERQERYAEAETVAREARWPLSYSLDLLRLRAELLEKGRRLEEAQRLAERAVTLEFVDPDSHALLARILSANGRLAEARQHENLALLLGGREIDRDATNKHLFGADYARLILPQPLVARDANGRLQPVGRVAVLDGRPLARRTWWRQALDALRPYVPRDDGRIVGEIRNVLRNRYDVIDNRVFEEAFRERLTKQHLQYQVHYSAKDLLELGNSLGADAVLVVDVAEKINLLEENADALVKLYFYSGLANQVLLTEAARTLPFFTLYRFNRLLLAAVALAFAALLLVYRALGRATELWRDPLKKARYFIRQGDLGRAALHLERHGYLDDYAHILGHYYFQEGDYIKALETFGRAKDAENAELALRFCPDNPTVNTTAAEIFLQARDFDRAELYFKKARNLLGVAKVYGARGDAKTAGRIMGQYYVESGNPDAAVGEYRKIGDYERAGQVLFYYQRYNSALTMFEKAKNDAMAKKCRLRMGERPDQAPE